jgi:hypothetical protein
MGSAVLSILDSLQSFLFLEHVQKVNWSIMNKQQLFDTVVNHLRKQGKKSIDAGGACMYRGPDGTKCAAGILITDEEYHWDLEGKIVLALTTQKNKAYLPGFAEVVGPNTDLMLSLQSVHDQFVVEMWEKELESVAATYHVVYTPPTIYPGTDPIL